ncbi:MAG: 30S ribosomal protein S8 [Bdellovibrionales bacterium]|nr:30S ribosomal protein S8 [Bdellovibrionales bacterium]
MDTIGEFLTRIRNAGLAKHDKVDIPSSNMREGIAQILQETGYIRSYKVAKDSKQGIMRVYLKYDEKGKPAISNLERVSRPSRRIYVKADKIRAVRSGFGMDIMSTNKGIMSSETAKNEKVGGELLCRVW